MADYTSWMALRDRQPINEMDLSQLKSNLLIVNQILEKQSILIQDINDQLKDIAKSRKSRKVVRSGKVLIRR